MVCFLVQSGLLFEYGFLMACFLGSSNLCLINSSVIYIIRSHATPCGLRDLLGLLKSSTISLKDLTRSHWKFKVQPLMARKIMRSNHMKMDATMTLPSHPIGFMDSQFATDFHLC